MDFDKIFFSFTGREIDAFTVRDCFTGFQIFGGTGSGKTSGSGKFLAQRFLKKGFGGLVLTVKPDECGEWQKWAKAQKRENDLIIFKPSEPYRFDFLRYEQGRKSAGGGSTFNLVDLLITAAKLTKPSDQQLTGGDQFFEDAGNELITKTVDLLSIAGEAVTVANILLVINSAPDSTKSTTLRDGSEMNEVFNSIGKDAQGQRTYKPFANMVRMADKKKIDRKLSKQQKRDFKSCCDYFLHDYATLAGRTRASVRMHATSVLYQLSRGELGLLFCNGEVDSDEIEIEPEQTYTGETGKIIIVDMPVMEWKKTGRLAQGLFKHLFQRAIERRTLDENSIPVFIWADEAQYFLGEEDQMFLTTARSAGCATVYLTQNIENYYSIMPESVARSLLGNLQTKIFHQNTDTSTNSYASTLAGRSWLEISGRTVNYSADLSASGNLGVSTNQQLHNKIEPEQFNELKTGGLHNDLIVEAVVFSGGRKWVRTKDTYDSVQFTQTRGSELVKGG